MNNFFQSTAARELGEVELFALSTPVLSWLKLEFNLASLWFVCLFNILSCLVMSLDIMKIGISSFSENSRSSLSWKDHHISQVLETLLDMRSQRMGLIQV